MSTVRQLRLVVEADDFDEAVRFYRDVLGLEEEEAYDEPPVYTHPVADSKGRYPVEIGPNGYAVRVSFDFFQFYR